MLSFGKRMVDANDTCCPVAIEQACNAIIDDTAILITSMGSSVMQLFMIMSGRRAVELGESGRLDTIGIILTHCDSDRFTRQSLPRRNNRTSSRSEGSCEYLERLQ